VKRDIKNLEELDAFVDEMCTLFKLKGEIVVELHGNEGRTLTQNRALHLYFGLLADDLNAAGYDMKKTLSSDVEVPWNAELVKQLLFKPVQEAQVDKKSTAKLTKAELDLVLTTVQRHIATVTGVTTAFPDKWGPR